MSTTSVPFQSSIRPDLTIPRRQASAPPMEIDDLVPRERRIAGPYGQASLQEAWDKLYRARALLEAEQSHLRDDRIALQGDLEALEHRERSVGARELKIQQLENLAALEREEAELEKESGSAIVRFTRAPFDMARSVFGGKK